MYGTYSEISIPQQSQSHHLSFRDPVRGELFHYAELAAPNANVAPGEKGAEEHYDLSDAIGEQATAASLNRAAR